MDTDEEMSREAYESQRDAAAPRCHKCRKSENQVAMFGCAVPTCRAFLCEACASETEWELEGCCDGSASPPPKPPWKRKKQRRRSKVHPW